MLSEQEFNNQLISSAVCSWLAVLAAVFIAYHAGFIQAVIFHTLSIWMLGRLFTAYKTGMSIFAIQIDILSGCFVELLSLLPYWIASHATPETTALAFFVLLPSRFVIVRTFMFINPHIPFKPDYENYVKGYEQEKRAEHFNLYL